MFRALVYDTELDESSAGSKMSQCRWPLPARNNENGHFVSVVPKWPSDGYKSFSQEAFKSGERFKTSMGVKGRGQGGWQEPGAEETDFSLRVKQKTGKRIIYNPKVKVRHKVYQYRTTKRFVAKRAYWEGYAKALLKHLHHPASSEANVLSTEHALLRRILFRLVPQTFGLFFHRPSIALQQLLLTVIVLSCVAAGYLKYELASLLRLGPSYE